MEGGAEVCKPHRFTVADYHRMGAAGILDEDCRVELIRGQIIDMHPIGGPHVIVVNRLNRLLAASVEGRAIVSVQNPVRLDDGSEPQPDFSLLRPRADECDMQTPSASEVLLVIEVSDSSLEVDRAVKVPLYAESGIPEYWIVNLRERWVEVYRMPKRDRYESARRVGPDGVLDIQALPGTTLKASEFLPRHTG